MTLRRSVCALDCPDTCSLQIGVAGDRVVSLHGDAAHPITQGFACVKTAKYPERQQSPDRLLFPQRRIGTKGEGRFEHCSWEDALDAIATRLSTVLDQTGPRSLLPFCYGGTLGQIESGQPLAFFRALGAIEQDQTMCATTGGAGWERAYGPDKLGTAPEDVPHAGLVLLWGINAARSNSHLMPWLKAARKNGAAIVHIDPYRNETSRFADWNLQPKVGTDAALALGIARELIRRDAIDDDFIGRHGEGFDEYQQACQEWTPEKVCAFCDISTVSFRQLVDQINQSPPLYLRVGYGMTRNEGGGNAMHAVALLPALTGAWKHRGGGGNLSTSGAFPWNRQRTAGRHLIRSGVRHVNQNQLGNELNRTDDPIAAMVVFNSNPAVVTPDSAAVRRGLQREDLFTVVLDHFQTDTSDYADFLLPATTFLEHPDLYGAYGHYHVQWAEPVVTARGEARPNTWVFAQLAKRLGLDDPTLY
ncbi:MAG: molybdopterin-dependent oxidoreductase, partial [Planctomycetota bacterium]